MAAPFQPGTPAPRSPARATERGRAPAPANPPASAKAPASSPAPSVGTGVKLGGDVQKDPRLRKLRETLTKKKRIAQRLLIINGLNIVIYYLDDGSQVTVPLRYNGNPRDGSYKLELATFKLSPAPGSTPNAAGQDIDWSPPPDVDWGGATTIDAEVQSRGDPERIMADPQLSEAPVGTRFKFWVSHPAAIYAQGSYYKNTWRIYNDPKTAPAHRQPTEIDAGTRGVLELKAGFPGKHVITCAVRFIPAQGSPGPERKLEYVQVVRPEAELLKEAHAAARAPDYVSFRAGLEMHRLNLMKGGLQDQSAAGVPYIKSSGSNPAFPGIAPNLARYTYTVEPVPTARTFRWYVRCADWSFMPTRSYHGYNRITVNGESAYHLASTGRTATWIIADSNVYTIVCEQFDDAGAKVGTARYRQVVESQQEREARTRFQGYMARVAAGIGKIQDGKEVGLQAAYVNRETGQTLPLVLFVGPDAKNPSKLVLLDLLPGVERMEYGGSNLAAALADFERGNAYPKGSIKLTVPANKSGIPEVTRALTTRGESTFSAWAKRTGWASLGLVAAGIIAGLIPGGQPVAAVCFISAGATGAVSGGLSLYDRLKQAEVRATGVALDVASIAASMIGAAGAVRALKLGTAFTFTGRTGRFLLYSGFTTNTLSGLIISVEGVTQINAILDNGKLTRSEKIDAIVRVLANLALQGFLLALSVKELAAVRGRASQVLGKDVARKLSPETLQGLNLLDDSALKRLAGMTAEQLDQVSRLVKFNPQMANLLAKAAGKDLALHTLEPLQGRININGQIQLHPNKLASMSEDELRDVLQTSKALKAVKGDLDLLGAAEKALVENLVKSSGQRLRFEAHLRQGEKYIDDLGATRNPYWQSHFSKMSAGERERLFDLGNANRGTGNNMKQASDWALSRKPKSVYEYVNLVELYAKTFEQALDAQISAYKARVEAEVRRRKTVAPTAKEQKLKAEVEKEFSQAEFQREIHGYASDLRKELTKKVENAWGTRGDPAKAGPGAMVARATYEARAAELKGHIGGTEIGSGLTNGEALARIRALPEVKFSSESSGVYHVEKHMGELPKKEVPGKKSRSVEFMASAQKTIQEGTVTPKMTPGGTRQFHFLRVLEEIDSGKVKKYELLAIVQLTEAGEVSLATYMGMVKKK